MSTPFTIRLKCFPPILCRLLAFDKGRALTADQIAERSGKMPDVINLLSVSEVYAMSRMTTWKGFGIHEALAFQRGTVGSFDDVNAMRRLDDYLRKRPTLAYLRRDDAWDDYYKPMLVTWRNQYPKIISTEALPNKSVRAIATRLTPLLT